MPTSQPQTADDIFKKCQDVGEKFMQAGVDKHHGTVADRVHYLHELPHAAEERYSEIFRQLDRNGKLILYAINNQPFQCSSLYL